MADAGRIAEAYGLLHRLELLHNLSAELVAVDGLTVIVHIDAVHVREGNQVVQAVGDDRGAVLDAPGQILSLVIGQFVYLVGEDGGEPRDGVQRCAYLVAHVLDEGRLHTVCLLGVVACQDELVVLFHQLPHMPPATPDEVREE